jgi:hypothetical protein
MESLSMLLEGHAVDSACLEGGDHGGDVGRHTLRSADRPDSGAGRISLRSDVYFAEGRHAETLRQLLSAQYVWQDVVPGDGIEPSRPVKDPGF